MFDSAALSGQDAFMRPIAGIALSLLLASIHCGCATTKGLRWGKPQAATSADPLEKLAKKRGEKQGKDSTGDQAMAASKAAKEPAPTKDTPFKPSRDTKPEGTTADAAAATAKTVASPAKPSTGTTTPPATPMASFTPDTLRIIEEELRDATPEERAEWYRNLKRVDPAVVPEILRARRLSRKLVETNTPLAALDETVRSHDDPPGRATSNPVNPAAAPGVAMSSTPPRSSQNPTGIDLAGYTAPSSGGAVTTAGYRSSGERRERVDHAVMRTDSQAAPTPSPIVLQGYVVDDSLPANEPARAPLGAPSNGWPNGSGSGLPPNNAIATVPATPPSVPWPQPSVKPPPPVENGRGFSVPTLPFGTNFVRDVVGLVPNRGTTANPVTPASANVAQPLPTAAWRTELDRTIAFLEQEVATLKPGGTSDGQADYLRKHVALRQLYLLTDRQERALTAIPGIEPADQEFWQQVFWGMANYLDVQHIPRPQDRATQTIAQMNTAVRRLQEQADLQIRNVAFCRQIQYYGNYDRFPRDEFRPGQEVLVYAEVDNFKSEPTADGQYRTLLRSSIELLSPNGEVRKQIDFPATEDLCRNYRRDYFHNYQFTIPDRLPLGPHTLKVTIFDELSGKMASYTQNFLVQ